MLICTYPKIQSISTHILTKIVSLFLLLSALISWMDLGIFIPYKDYSKFHSSFAFIFLIILFLKECFFYLFARLLAKFLRIQIKIFYLPQIGITLNVSILYYLPYTFYPLFISSLPFLQ